MATRTQQFTVKAVTKNGEGKKFYNEVGRLFLRDGDKGTNGSLYLHLHAGVEYAVFPVEPKEDKAAGE